MCILCLWLSSFSLYKRKKTQKFMEFRFFSLHLHPNLFRKEFVRSCKARSKGEMSDGIIGAKMIVSGLKLTCWG